MKIFLSSQIYFIKLIFKERPGLFILLGLIAIFSAIITPFSVLIQKESIDSISEIEGDIQAFKGVIVLLVIYAILTYGSQVFNELQDYIFVKITYTVNYVLKMIVNNKLIQIPLKEFENSTFHDTLILANHSLDSNGIRVIQNLINIIASSISLITLIGVLISIHWSLPLALFLSTLPGIIVVFMTKFKGYRIQREISSNERELNFTESLFYDKRSLKEIKIYNLGEFLFSKWGKLYDYTAQKKIALAFWELKNNAIAIVLVQIASIGVSIFLVYQIFGNNLSMGSYVALVGATTTMQGLFATIGGNLGSIFEIAMYNNALMSILTYEIEENEKEDSNLIKIKNIESISIKDASFYYPNSNIKVLDNVTLKINKGDRVSIVGSNGSGKTTLAHCLMGLYDIDQGSFEINGVSINGINKKSFFKRTSMIFQDFTKYKYSVRENIGIGDLEKIDNEEELYKLLNRVGLDGKVENLKRGLDTYLTKDMPDGTDFSGGEWQKIAITRAFLKEADLILLDEPTAALDPKSELKIFDIFHELSRDKTTISISHRIGPTKRSDYIIVMDRGKIVEVGSFEELLNNQGLFYEMYESQSLWYKEIKDDIGRVYI